VPRQPALRQLCAAAPLLPARLPLLTPESADLAQQQLLADPSLVAYLAYLRYWRSPQYARFLSFPACLPVLELLQSPVFRAALASLDATEFLWRTQFSSWEHGRRRKEAALPERWRGTGEAEAEQPAAYTVSAEDTHAISGRL